MFDKPFLCRLMLCLLPALPLAAAPGNFTPVGPFGGPIDGGVEEMVFPGSAPGRILIRTGFDLFESRDDGASWRSVLANFPQIRPAGLSVDPLDAERWYVVDQAGPTSAVWQTLDAGRQWSALPLPELAAGTERELHFFVDRFAPASFALEVRTARDQSFRRFLSRDHGASWSELELASSPTSTAEILGINGGTLYLRQARYDVVSGSSVPLSFEGIKELYFDLERPSTLYVAVDFGPYGILYSSTDRGTTLVRLRDFGPGCRGGLRV